MSSPVSVSGVSYFTLTINPTTGEVTLALLDNVWHGDTASADDSVVLSVDEGVLTLVQWERQYRLPPGSDCSS
ncbi:DUF5801 repeats-in-toxin domain-containing protein [Aeromonas veronii]